MPKQRGSQDDFDTSDVDPDLFEDGDSNDAEWSDEPRQRDEDFYASLLDPLPDEDDDTEEDDS